MNKSLFPKINTGLKILVLGCALPLLLHDTVSAQEGCSKAEIKANIERLHLTDSLTDSQEAYTAWQFIVRCQEKSITLLIDTLGNKAQNPAFLISVIDALSEIKSSSEEVLDTLISFVADKNDDSDVRCSAIDALGEIKSFAYLWGKSARSEANLFEIVNRVNLKFLLI